MGMQKTSSSRKKRNIAAIPQRTSTRKKPTQKFSPRQTSVGKIRYNSTTTNTITEKKRSIRFFHAISTIMTCLSLLILVITGIAWSSKKILEDKVTKLHLLLGGNSDGATDILLVGVDSRTDIHGNPLSAERLRNLHANVTNSQMNTDTIVLIRIPDNGTSAIAISIPRDTYVTIPDIGKAKLNSAYGSTREMVLENLVKKGKNRTEAEKIATNKGQQALINVITDLTGVVVDHYAEVGLDGFAELTDAVGGVEVCLKHRVNEPLSGAHFSAGRQILSGDQALSFVRQRHDLPRGDIDRITRQQVLMANLAYRILSSGNLKHPETLTQLINVIHDYVAIDANWDLVDLATKLSSLATGQIRFATIPIINLAGWSDDGQQSVVIVDKNRVRSWIHSLINTSMAVNDAPVDVYNIGNIEGIANKVANNLATLGYPRGEVGNHDNIGNRVDSIVLTYTRADEAHRIAQTLGLPMQVDVSIPKGKVYVLLTNNYHESTSSTRNTKQTRPTDAISTNSVDPRPFSAKKSIPSCVN